ncbi:hypothetical protein D3C72_2021830 [compost metagenome]
MHAARHEDDQREPHHVGPVDRLALDMAPAPLRAGVHQHAVQEVSAKGQPDRAGHRLPRGPRIDRHGQHRRDRQHQPHAGGHERIRRQAAVEARGGDGGAHGKTSFA